MLVVIIATIDRIVSSSDAQNANKLEAVTVDYAIVEKPSFNVVGKSLRVSIANGENLQLLPKFWQECLSDGTYNRLLEIAASDGVTGNASLGICMDFEGNMEAFTYMIAVESRAKAAPEGMVMRSIPAATWARFKGTGAIPKSIQDLWASVMSEFFESEPYVHGDAPSIEIYPVVGPMPSSPDYKFEVWAPVKSK
jgi:AraC family transcriptional regulator